MQPARKATARALGSAAAGDGECWSHESDAARRHDVLGGGRERGHLGRPVPGTVLRGHAVPVSVGASPRRESPDPALVHAGSRQRGPVLPDEPHVRATGDLELLGALWPNARRALGWIQHHGDPDRDGFVEYRGHEEGLQNQGWKDSWDSIRFRDGSFARDPIALVEVQGYVLDAYRRCRELSSRLGDAELAREMDEQVARSWPLCFDRLWIPARGFFAEALDGEKRQVDALTSNAGHLLWSRAVPLHVAGMIADRLLSPELSSGFGIPTMGSGEEAYNPISYHNGSIWPHENSMIAQGLARYGFHSHASSVIAGMLAAASHYPDYALPELFGGYASGRFPAPVEYPTANKPQAWSSGAILLLLQTISR